MKPLLLSTCLLCAAIPFHLAMGQDAAALEEQVALIRGALADPTSHIARKNSAISLHVNLASILQQLNHLSPDGGRRIAEAEIAYRTAISIIEKDKSADQSLLGSMLGNLGALLMEDGRPGDALLELERGIKLAEVRGALDELSSISFNRAKALALIGRLEEADLAYSDCADLAYGISASSFSKSTAAMESMSPALLKKTEDVSKTAHRLDKERKDPSKKKKTASPQEQWLANIRQMELSWLDFALFKGFNKLKQYDAAWEAVQRANHVMRETVSYGVEADWNTIRTLTSVFKGPMGIPGYSDSIPIFVVGLPRSGSTLVEQIFAANSDARTRP
eukprot:gene12366-15547_t